MAAFMQGTRDSIMHRSLLCGSLNGTVEGVNSSSLGLFPGSQPRETTYTSERTHYSDTLIPTVTGMAPMLSPCWSFPMFHPMGRTAAEYYPDQAPPLPMCKSQPQQFFGYYPTADGGFATEAYADPIVTTSEHLVAPADFGGMFNESPVATYQPPIPPATPESPIPPNPPFYFHPCRWLSGPQCDGRAPGKNREMGEHLRVFHHFVGHERDPVRCEWENCGQTMQRMNIPRHIVSRHLLAAASCRFCSKRFSRPDVVSRHERTCGGVCSNL